MKTPVFLTRRRLAAALAAPFAAAPARQGQSGQAGERRPGTIRDAAAKLMAARPGKNVSPSFRFIP